MTTPIQFNNDYVKRSIGPFSIILLYFIIYTLGLAFSELSRTLTRKI